MDDVPAQVDFPVEDRQSGVGSLLGLDVGQHDAGCRGARVMVVHVGSHLPSALEVDFHSCHLRESVEVKHYVVVTQQAARQTGETAGRA
jgi:hypothetical protein